MVSKKRNLVRVGGECELSEFESPGCSWNKKGGAQKNEAARNEKHLIYFFILPYTREFENKIETKRENDDKAKCRTFHTMNQTKWAKFMIRIISSSFVSE